MSEICYKNNFLKQVIAKVDFAQPLSNLSEESLIAAVTEIRKRFKISEQKTAIQQGIEITDTQVTSSKTEFPEWNFHSIDRDKSLKLNQHFLQIILTKYHSESDFQEDLINPISHILAAHPSTVISRTGVRFINVFDFKELSDFKSTSLYFANNISDCLANIANSNQCTRSFLINEFMEDDIKWRVQTGFFNPDYPAVIKKHHFAVDIDAYIDFPHQISDISGYFKKFHSIIQRAFESSITEKMRNEVLNG